MYVCDYKCVSMWLCMICVYVGMYKCDCICVCVYVCERKSECMFVSVCLCVYVRVYDYECVYFECMGMYV